MRNMFGLWRGPEADGSEDSAFFQPGQLIEYLGKDAMNARVRNGAFQREQMVAKAEASAEHIAPIIEAVMTSLPPEEDRDYGIDEASIKERLTKATVVTDQSSPVNEQLKRQLGQRVVDQTDLEEERRLHELERLAKEARRAADDSERIGNDLAPENSTV